MAKESKLKLGIIGGGLNSAIGMTHKIALKMDDRFDIAAGCFSRNEQMNGQTGKDWCVDRLYSNYMDLLNNEKERLDGVVVLTPTTHHTEIVKDALELNLPVICEKTLTDTLEDAALLSRLVKKTKGFLIVTYNYTGYPMVRELRQMIRAGKLGKIIHIKAEMPQEGFIRLANDGSIPIPQKWRLGDGEISTLSLDLGTHLSSLIDYLTKAVPIKAVAMVKSYGHHEVIDNISCLVEYSEDFDCNMWYSKSALGHKNGLSVEVYGENGSVFWRQMEPELLIFNDRQGRTIHLDRSSKGIQVANLKRYERFKSGHPAGFIEAFANYYYDAYDALVAFKNGEGCGGEHIFTIDSSVMGLSLMAAIEKSSASSAWENVGIKRSE